jgi:sphinganine-1-phosphate aldolase
MHLPFNNEGRTKEDIVTALDNYGKHDADWRRGRTFSLVFYPGGEVADILHMAYKRYFFENGLNPSVFKSLKQMESEVISMTLSMLNAPESAVGNMTSGGTESIICAVKSAKKYAASKGKNVLRGNIVMPDTAHPAFNKAADYLDLEVRIVPCKGDDLQPDLEQMKALINADTVMIVGSAPAYPHGYIDPLEAINKIAQDNHIWFHVDACVGGYIIPFLEQTGHSVPVFDFRLPGVHSISLDIHKYGYGPKGSSAVVYRNSEMRKKQYFVYTAWPGGLYASPSVSGTRPGGAIAGSWAVMNFLGKKGYQDYAAKTIAASKKIQDAVNKTEGLKVVGNPLTPVFSFMSEGKVDIYRLGDELSSLGWHLDRQLIPASLHLTVSYGNIAFVDDFIRDLDISVKKLAETSLSNIADGLKQGVVKQAAKLLPEAWIKKLSAGSIQSVSSDTGESAKTAPLYGLMGELSGTGTLDEMVLDLLDAMNKPATTNTPK